MNAHASSVPGYAKVATTDEETATNHASPVLVTAEAQVPSPSINNNNDTASLLDNLSWQDNFYANEPDIVAVIDVDSEAMNKFHRCYACEGSMWAFHWLLCGTLGLVLEAYFWSIIAFGCFVVKIPRTWMHAKKGMGFSRFPRTHMAFTLTSLRFDQENPDVSKKFPLGQIVSSSAHEGKFRSHWCCGEECTLNVVALQLAGAQKFYCTGVKDMQEFQRVLARLQDRLPAEQEESNT